MKIDAKRDAAAGTLCALRTCMKWLTLLMVLVPTATGCPGGRTDVGGDAGTEDAGSCHRGSTLFTMQSANAADFCVGAPGACSNQWLAILDPLGVEIAIDHPCATECSTCQPVGCPALCAAPSRMSSGGVQRTWDGTYYASRTCGSNISCAQSTCAPPGRYIAKMCAYRDLSHTTFCSPATSPTCTEVAFDWPPANGAGTVRGFIGDSTDAGACCPESWLMYSCTYSDGGAGFNCHNPALGCASSTTCGAGCDAVVEGRCTTQRD